MTDTVQERAPFRHFLLEIFAVSNLGILGFDIYLAHSTNEFAHPAEWIPLGFSAIATALLVPGLLRGSYHLGGQRWIGILVGGASIAVGILGMLLHLQSTFFAEQTLRNLVYSAPFAAPLSYAGVGFLLVLNRMEPIASREWGTWVIFFAMGGFVGLLAVSLGDHAQNGFFVAAEWIPVVAAALAASFLLTAIVRLQDRGFLRLCLGMMVIQMFVGGLGFVLHVRAGLGGVSESVWENLIFGAPIFAPLLFANLGILAAIGLWDVLAESVGEPPSSFIPGRGTVVGLDSAVERAEFLEHGSDLGI